jgi:hypothetical protein
MAQTTKATSATKDQPSILSKKNRMIFTPFKPENIGDHVIGIYVGKYNSSSDKYGYQEFENYILVTENGDKKVMRGRNADKKSGKKVIYGMERIPLGAKIAFIYDRDKDTGKGNPAKVIEIGYEGEKDLDTLRDFKEKYNMEEVADELSKSDDDSEPEEVVEDEVSDDIKKAL